MPSNRTLDPEAFVWIWLPGETEPVVAGRLAPEGTTLVFNYGQSYLERKNKIPIYEPELPLLPGILPLLNGLTIPGCIRDGSPDAWGRRVLIHRKFGTKGAAIDGNELDELSFLLESGSDRVGALDFQRSPTEYRPRAADTATLPELLESANRVEKGLPLSPALERALYHGSSIGGARPKAQIEHEDRKYIAKFSSSSDLYSVIKAEFIAMRLARRSGLEVAPVSLEKAAGKDVLLVERFDRTRAPTGWLRKSMVSALTLFGLDEMMARYASYETLAEIVRHRFEDAPGTLAELYRRLVFNVLVSNTDDHARNHAAFWNGKTLSLTPAYDICPQSRIGNEASQAMLIDGEERMSRIDVCLKAARHFLLSRSEAIALVERLLRSLIEGWAETCDEAELNAVDRKLFASRQFLNPYAFENLPDDGRELARLGDEFRARYGS